MKSPEQFYNSTDELKTPIRHFAVNSFVRMRILSINDRFSTDVIGQ